MANSLWGILQSIMPPDQPPRTPTDQFMEDQGSRERLDLYKMIEGMSQNPALNFNVGMMGPPSFPRGGGPWLNISPNSRYMFEPERLLSNGEMIAPGGNSPESSKLIEAIGRALAGRQPDIGVLSGSGSGRTNPLSEIVDSLLSAITGLTDTGGHNRPLVDVLREVGYYPRLPDWARRLLEVPITDPNHPTMRN